MQRDGFDDSLGKIKEIIMSKPSSSTKFAIYRTEMNSKLSLHEVYGDRVYIPDYLRQSFTRLRLMSHELKVETGRWSRLPREERVCVCNNEVVQDEKHVLLACPLLAHIRQRFRELDYSNICNLLNDEKDPENLCKYVREVMKCIGNLTNA